MLCSLCVTRLISCSRLLADQDKEAASPRSLDIEIGLLHHLASVENHDVEEVVAVLAYSAASFEHRP
ncbi:hypothetical protein BDZ90DRAFT_39906 [Jaminaea rosea]|uniref:Uncharacterized protein n=1 Tax=Jaminaea rosea TaxID=1569628 RepID=A0A316UMK9_9BASI|nr:hypothetical protein BDZ90DRAFT_39906 [Jaminaea rosea]PWN26489.1 hypothetical protein BDZ90DRAFT_39906 [Jaminaea rosea]